MNLPTRSEASWGFLRAAEERTTPEMFSSFLLIKGVRSSPSTLWASWTPAAVARVRWAGRLHDLGKIAVDSSVLGKRGRLDESEWEALRRHPRLSARLLRRYRFAAPIARAVEYHHERYDGDGYYGVEGDEIPLAAHLLIVADSYDAMTTDRPYRRGLSSEEALAEIETGAGQQFHPLVARAFAAQLRGHDPLERLSPGELAELRRLSVRPERKRRTVARVVSVAIPSVPVAGVVVGLGAVAFDRWQLAIVGLGVSLAGLAWNWRQRARASRLADRLTEALAGPVLPVARLGRFADALSKVVGVSWAGLVSWHEVQLTGSVELGYGPGERPSEAGIAGLFVRDPEALAEVLIVPGAVIGLEGSVAAIPVERAEERVLYLVVVGSTFPADVERALRILAGRDPGGPGSRWLSGGRIREAGVPGSADATPAARRGLAAA